MKDLIVYILLIGFNLSIHCQVSNFKDKFELPDQVKETSGLLFFKGKIITHNDSGDSANLYELDSLNGNLLRTINITNATNVDWEDIAEDNTHIYIGDFGNNNGNRTDLKIYKILKSDFENSNTVTAKIISFAYEDQTDYTTRPNNNNFDAEALIAYNNSLYIFSKNWLNVETRVYKLPTLSGNYTAIKISEANVEGLITGAVTSNDHIILCGYDATAPFLIFISANRSPDENVFSNGFEKYSFTNELGAGHQVEGITIFDEGKFYISREASNNQFFTFTQKLFEFTDNRALTLGTKFNNKSLANIYPNPIKTSFIINSNKPIKDIYIYNLLGKKVLNSSSKNINISALKKGVYMIKILFDDRSFTSKKIIKL